MTQEDDDEGSPRAPRRDISTRKKVLAGVLALLLVGTFAGSLLGGTRDTGDDTTTTTARPGTTPSTTATTTPADRQALVDAGVALATALTPVPDGDVQFAGEGLPSDQNAPEAALVDVVAVGWYDRYAFVVTRGGPPEELEGCLSLRATAPDAVGEINLGGPCAEHGAAEAGRMAGFLLPRGALWILELQGNGAAGGSGATERVVVAQLFLAGGTLGDGANLPVDTPPIAPELANTLLPLARFRDANPPDGPVAPSD